MNIVTTSLAALDGPGEGLPLRSYQAGVPQPKPSHLFVDNVRFWSMFAVVALHSSQILGFVVHLRPTLVMMLTTPIKFGTIAFFLMSGFLAGRGVETAHPWIYLRRRIERIVPPWCFWIAALTLALLARDLLHHRLVPQSHALFGALERDFYFSFFDTAFWFVPNLLVCLGILLLFRKMHGNPWFGAALFCLSLFYAANIYWTWIPSRHTEALFGFVFYLWLGSYASREHAAFDRGMAKVSLGWFFLLALLTAFLAYGEALLLRHRGAEDPMNSLRLSNQVFSVAAVLLIYKFRRATWPRFVHVRDDTFGVYLAHPLVLLLLWPALNTHPLRVVVGSLAGGRVVAIVFWLLVILVVYGLALAITKVMVGFAPLRFLVGLETKDGHVSRGVTRAAGLVGYEPQHTPAKP